MTFREISDVINFHTDKVNAESKAMQQNAAFAAFYGAYYSRIKDFPDSLAAAFPWLYDRTDTGGVSAENWQESKRTFSQLVAIHNRAVLAGGGSN